MPVTTESKFSGRGKRKATPRPNAGRPADAAAFAKTLDRLEWLIERAKRKPHTHEEAERIVKRIEQLAARYAAQQQQ